MDMAGHLWYINKIGADLFNISEEKIANEVNIRQYLTPENVAQMERGLAAALSGAPSPGEIYALKLPDGRIMKAIVHTSIIQRQGKAIGFRGVVVDFTERLRLKDQLEESQKLLSGILQASPVGVFRMDPAGNVTFINEMFSQITDISIENIKGRHWADILPAEDKKLLLRNMSEGIRQRKMIGAESRFVHPDGSIFWFFVQVVPFFTLSNVLEGWVGTITDITQRKKMEDALADNKEYLDKIFSSVNVGILVITADTHTIIDVNPASMKIIGSPKENIVGKLCNHVVCPEEEGNCPITVHNKTCDNAERILLTAKGTSIPIIKNVVRIKLHGQDCLLETFIDNTERKRMADALRENQEMLSGILRASPVGIFRLGKAGNMLFVNEMWTTITGYTLDKLTGKYWERILHPDDHDHVLQEVKQAQRERRMIKTESRFIRPDGTIFWVYEQAMLLIGPNGTPNGWVGTITDITERKKVEDELAASEEKYRALAENTADILYSLDLNGIMTYVSPSVNRYGYLVEEVISQPFTRLIHPRDRSAVMKNFMKEIAAKKLVSSRFRIIDAWGSIHWIEENSTLRVDVNGEITGLYGVIRDITDRYQAEEAIRLANKKLNLLNNITRHDILNTITGLFGCVDMAKATEDPIERAELLDQIKELIRVVQRQIAFTREYQSVGINAPIWQNLRDSINTAVVNFSQTRLEIRLEIANIEIFADPLLEKVFYNLVDNAIRYGEKITAIKFYNLITDNGLSLICEDDGVGIPGDQKESIFERGIGKNTGMGLFLTREILLITGITIEENGQPGHGARFEIIIPNGMFRFVQEKKRSKNSRE